VEIERALEIIRSLAEGKDPYSGQELPKMDPYQQGDTVRALTVAMDGMRTLEHKMRRIKDLPMNSGNPWGPEEDRELLKAFKCGKTVSEMVKKHKRTEGAITSRLLRLGVVRISSIKE
jgi:hypothetical protein